MRFAVFFPEWQRRFLFFLRSLPAFQPVLKFRIRSVACTAADFIDDVVLLFRRQGSHLRRDRLADQSLVKCLPRFFRELRKALQSLKLRFGNIKDFLGKKCTKAHVQG